VPSLFRRGAAALALWAWSASFVLPLAGAHARVLDDAACTLSVLGSPHPVPQFEALHPLVDDGHCAICHLQRAFHGAFAPTVKGHRLADTVTAAASLSRWSIRGERRLNVPTRAPPSA
jgi:hypothetical protein